MKDLTPVLSHSEILLLCEQAAKLRVGIRVGPNSVEVWPIPRAGASAKTPAERSAAHRARKKAGIEFKRPVSLRPKKYERAPRAEWKRIKAAALIRDNHRCVYCGGDGSGFPLEFDHVRALKAGGRDVLANIVTACKPCNSSKKASNVWQWAEGRQS